jgi:uncharacterized protein (TIGR02466 family)
MNLEITKHNIFVEEAWSFIMPDHEKWRKEIKNIILVENNKEIHKHTTIPGGDCNIKAKRTAWDSHYRYPSIRSLTSELSNIIKEWIKQENFDAPAIEIKDCWINWYGKNNHAVPHFHGVHLALVYFVDVEDSKADFLFIREDRYELIRKENNETFHNNMKYVKVKNGTVLMFNGALMHSVTPNLSNSTRITFAANYVVDYEAHTENKKKKRKNY